MVVDADGDADDKRTSSASTSGVFGKLLERHLKRAVSRKQSQGQCCYRAEVDHVLPFAVGGKTELKNLSLLCRAHNRLEAEKHFGSKFMREVRGAATTRRNSA